MKLLFLSTTFPTPQRPFQGAFNQQMVQALREAKHDVRVIAPVPWLQRLSWTASNTAANAKQPSSAPEQFPTYYYPPLFYRSLYHHFYNWSVASALRHTLRDFQAEAVVGYWAHPDGQSAVDIAQQLGVPGVIIVGGTDIRILARSGKRRTAIQRALHSASRVVALSHDLSSCLSGLGIAPKKISVLYRGIDLERFSPGCQVTARQKLKLPTDKKILLWIGRFCDVKNPQLFVEAFRKLVQTDEHYRAYMLGDGPLRPGIAKWLAKENLQEQCQLIGNVAHQALVDWYRAADRTVLTSDSEGIPNVLQESIACGTPFVATNVGGVSEIASEHHDRLVEPGNATHLCEALRRSLQASVTSARSFHPSGQREFADRFIQAIGIKKAA